MILDHNKVHLIRLLFNNLGVSIAWVPIITGFKESQLFVYIQVCVK